jgi:hypothetical protein
MCWFWVKTRDLRGREGSESFDRLYLSHPNNGIRPMLILSLNNFYKCVINVWCSFLSINNQPTNIYMLWRGRRGIDHIVVGFATSNAISTYYH